MTAFELSTFKFLKVTSENGTIKAIISEKDGFFGSRVSYSQSEIQIHGMLKRIDERMDTSSKQKRILKNRIQLMLAFDSVRNVKIENNIHLEVII